MGMVYTPPVTRAYRYLSPRLEGVLVEREYEPTGWEPSEPLVIIKSGGGSGQHVHQLLNVSLSFDVRAGELREAEKLAFQVANLLREWDEIEDRVYLRSESIPAWDPEPERRIPAYTFTFAFDFKGVIVP